MNRFGRELLPLAFVLGALVATGATEAAEAGKTRAEEIAELRAAAARAEATYAAARNKRTYEAYVLASQRWLQAAYQAAAGADPAADERKRGGADVAGLVRAWLEAQDAGRYDAPPEGVVMWMRLLLGRALALSDESEKACSEGFDEVLGYSPTDFELMAQPWAWRVWLTARLCKAQVLAEKGDWPGVQSLIDPAFFARPESRGGVLGIQARILKASALGKLGEYKPSSDEFNLALREIEALRIREPDAAGRAAGLRARAVRDMAEMVIAAMDAGCRINAR